MPENNEVQVCNCNNCTHCVYAGGGDSICTGSPIKIYLIMEAFSPTDDYCWCKGVNYESI